MAGLGTAVIANDQVSSKMPYHKIGQQTFACIPEAQVHNDICSQSLLTRLEDDLGERCKRFEHGLAAVSRHTGNVQEI